jgi:flagellin
MSLSIQTNVDSLVAQENLLTNSQFQSNTIQQLTSGYRINSAGDDPAGLAVANGYAAAISELTQGYANGSDALSQLQIMDGGMSNISQIVNTLQTLATESASGSFTGDRTTLNNQFQTDLSEIDRQAQSIGLNIGGTFAKLMSVYFGTGSGSQSAANGVVNVDLSHATVDAQSLGLSGVQAVTLGATTAADYDLGASSTTSVNAIATTAANVAALTNGDTSFTFTGPGFGDARGVKINVNMTGVDDTTTLVNAINAAIQSAAATAGASNGAFAAANITASIHTDSAGKEQLAFNSSNSAFQVTADDLMSNALMGNLAVAGAPTGAAAGSAGSSLIADGTYMLGTKGTPNTETDVAFTAVSAGDVQQSITISANDSSGKAHTLTVALNTVGTGDSMADALKTINTALQNSDDTTLQQVTAVQNPAGTAMNFISTLPGFQISLGTTADGASGLGTSAQQGTTLTALQVGTGGTADISTQAGAQAAVTAITAAVSLLGSAQAAVGTGEDQLNFASSLAQSQITNFSSAESTIKDANVAQQAANLTKAQVLQQSTIAAMAQANAEPQALLTLLKSA